MSYLHEATGTLVVGDSLVHSSSYLAAEDEWSGEFATCVPELNYDAAQARTSVQVLAEYDVDTARLTHGPNVENPSDELTVLLSDLAANR